ncbi:MAG: hypothetical protein QM477_01275 [Planctomycetota bacterium]
MKSFLARTLVLLLAFLMGAVSLRLLTADTAEASFADSGKRYVAVTGPYQAGVALLYVLDQETQHLAVYEARGGATNSHRLQFVGARNIELDTMLDGYHDESDYTHKELEAEFLKSGILEPEDSTK